MDASTVMLLRMLVLIEAVTSSVIRDVIVNTKYGRLRGTRNRENYPLGSAAKIPTFDKFLGVPYAKPPTGARRFKPPEPPDRWTEVRDSTHHGWVCPQIIFHPDTEHKYQNEDCLFLDIYSPYEAECHQGPDTDKRYPVLVYIHGGSYEVGSGKLYDGSVLTQFGVVVVTINYRLGALGFMTSGDHYINGNYGLLDQIEALKWVSENIGHFRGDPSQVTVFGHSAGGASVGLLLVVPQTKELFRSVIAMSGSATASYSVYDPDLDHRDYVRRVGDIFRCPRSEDFSLTVHCLRQVPARNFIDQRKYFPRYDPIDPEFRPFVDGTYITDVPRDLFVQGRFHHIPTIVGTIKDEFGNYFNGGARHNSMFDSALDVYLERYVGNPAIAQIVRHDYTDWHQLPLPVYDRGALLSDMHMIAPTVDMADIISRDSDSLYQYHIAVDDIYHSFELNFVFGAPFSGRFADEMIFEGNVSRFSQKERELSIKVMTVWTNFAKYGEPILEHVPESDPCSAGASSSPQHEAPPTSRAQAPPTFWHPYSFPRRDYLHLGTHHTDMRSNLRADKVAFWNNLVPKLKGQPPLGDYRSPRVDQAWGGAGPRSGGPDTVNLWVFLATTVILLVIVVLLTVVLIKCRIKHQRFTQTNHAYDSASNNITPSRV